MHATLPVLPSIIDIKGNQLSSISSSLKRTEAFIKDAIRQKYADVSECADEKNLQRIIYNVGVVPENYLLDAGETSPAYTFASSVYANYLRYQYGLTRLCQKTSPETPSMSALYGVSKEPPRYEGIHGRYRGIQDCPKNAALLKPVISYPKGLKAKPSMDTVHPAGALAPHERSFPDYAAWLALRSHEDLKASNVCQMKLPHAPERSALFYIYADRMRAGDTATPYANVPLCKEPNEQHHYRIVSSSDGGKDDVALVPPHEVLGFDQRDPEAARLEEIRARYRISPPRIPVHEGVRAKGKIRGVSEVLAKFFEAASIDNVCQKVVRGAQECVKTPDSKDCAYARYGLFFSWVDPRLEVMAALTGSVSVDEEKVRAFYDAYQNAMPPQMSECADVSSAVRVNDDMRERGIVLEMASTAWPEIEASSGEIVTHIENITKERHVFSDDETKYLKKVVYAAQNAAVSDKDLVAIATDIAAVTSKKSEFIYAFQSVVLLRYARSTHAQNKRAYGVGISRDFEHFAETTERNLREGRVGVRTMNYGEKLSGGLAYYNSQTNTMMLPPLDTNMSVLYFWMEPVLHELYHSYQDATKRRESLVASETEARLVGLKSSILMMQRLQEEYGRHNDGKSLPIDILPWDMTRELVLATNEDTRKMMKCQGYKDSMIEDAVQNFAQMATNWEFATQGVRDELRGAKNDAAVWQDWAMLTYQIYFGMWHGGLSQQHSSELGWLRFLGHTQALNDRQRGASMSMVRRFAFERAQVRPGTPEHMAWLYQAMSDVVAHAAAKMQVHGVNGEYVPAELMESLVEEFVKVSYHNDGVK